MKALVTGGAGYIGSHLVDRLLLDGHEVVVLDDLSTGKMDNIAHNLSHPHFRFTEGSILSPSLVREAMQGCQEVFHLGAVVGVKYVVDDPLRVIRVNVLGTEIVFKEAVEAGARVLLASTSEVYGKSRKLPFNEDEDRVLGSTKVARWAYSTAKALDEHLAFAYHKKGLEVSIVRYFNSYGPRLDAQGYGSVVARFVTQALKGDPITVYGKGRQSRSFTYIDDSVEGTMRAATLPQAIGEVFNIGRGEEITILELARTIKEMARSPSEIVFLSYEEAHGLEFEDVPHRLPDVEKAKCVLGFVAQVPVEEGLERTISWFRSVR